MAPNSNSYALSGASETKLQAGSFKNIQAERFISQIGNTPLIDLSQFSPNPSVKILAKAEFLNPSCSIKDRIVKHIFDEAEAKGLLKPGCTVVAASSGNTGASVAMLASMRGYHSIITTNTKCSKEKCDIIRAYGAELIVGPSGVPADSPEHYMNIADRICEENEGYFNVQQYDNPLNPEAYYCSLAPELWKQSNGTLTHFVAAGSTGGTISGNGRYLKEQNPNIKIVMADPHGSIFFDYWKTGIVGTCGKFEVEGVGKDSIPGAMNFKLVDDMVQVTDREAFSMCRQLSATEGLLAGGSSGLNIMACVKLAAKIEGPAVIATVMPDSGIKYLSKIFNDEWMAERNYL